MPEWVVHTYTCSNFCGIPRGVCEEINRFIDSPPHDKNRAIDKGHWFPEPLLYLASVVYEKWGYSGLKAMLLHNLLDYANTLVIRSKYGWLVRDYGPHYYTYFSGPVYEVLDNVERDFAEPLSKLRGGASPQEVAREVASSWAGGVRYFDDLVKVFGEGNAVELLKDLLRAVRELRGCLGICVLEVAYIESYVRGMYRDYCPLCPYVASPEPECVPIPLEYARRGIAYRVHRECFESLRSRARALLGEGLPLEEALRRLLAERYRPPSVAYEALKSATGGKISQRTSYQGDTGREAYGEA